MVQRITIAPSQVLADSALIELQAEQSHYLIRVLRLKAGDRFIAQDGLGNQWLAAIAAQLNHANIIEKLLTTTAPLPDIQLVAALPKGNGFDTVVRQTTELGVTHIHPVTTARTLLKPSANKLARWKRIAQEASEQSERTTVPHIIEPVPFQTCLASLHPALNQKDEHTHRFICVARKSAHTANDSTANEPTANGSTVDGKKSASNISKHGNNNHLLSRLLFHQQKVLSSANPPSVIIAIGPEGGWTTDEITVAVSYNYEVVSLGSAILRAVTAPITALSLVTAARELLI
ncbi:MAG: 16S rRNA (uracil(1498)-N(3))-methyltransferase [Phormidesmis sp.]